MMAEAPLVHSHMRLLLQLEHRAGDKPSKNEVKLALAKILYSPGAPSLGTFSITALMDGEFDYESHIEEEH